MSFKKDLKGDFSNIPTFVPTDNTANSKRMNISNNISSSTLSSSSSNKKSHSSSSKKSGSRNRSSHAQSKRNVQSFNNSNNRNQFLDDSSDILSIIKSSKKGADISHLLTYSYAQDDDDHINNNEGIKNRPRSKQDKKKSSGIEIHLSGLSYINANYKFILNYKGDYKPQLLDPNLPLNVKDIIRVIVKQHDYHCPICLGDEFVAPRMTRCGHIFCFSCLLNMFDNTREDKTKTSLGNRHNPSISCPLCSEIIKENFAQLPVLIEQVKENESKLNSNHFTSLSLMHRANSKIYSQRVSNFYLSKGLKANIPWISHDCTPLNYKQYSPYISNSRLMICDLDFIISCYQKEIDDLMTQKLLDCEYYGDSGKFFDLAIEKITLNIKQIQDEIDSSIKLVQGPSKLDENSLEAQLSQISLTQETSLPNYNDGFYYYQSDINSRIHYFLAPLDVHVINELFNVNNTDGENPAYRLPLTLRVYIENINFDEGKVTPGLVKKYPFLGNLPYGAELGFLEVDWRKFDSSFIPVNEDTILDNTKSKYPIQLSQQIKKRLQNRSRDINHKRVYEENARIRGELRREKETLKVFSNDRLNNQNQNDDEEFFASLNDAKKWNKSQSNHIQQIGDVPVLKGVSNSFNVLANVDNTSDSNIESEINLTSTGGSIGSNSKPSMTVKTSVWGTRVPVVLDPEEEELRREEDRQFDEMLRKAKDEAMELDSNRGKKGRKGRKARMVTLPI